MMCRFLYFLLVGLFVIGTPLVFAFPDTVYLEILQAVTAETQKKVANADYFLEKRDTLIALNGIQKKFLAPAEGLKNITEFLESIAHLSTAEQRALIKKRYEETVRIYEESQKDGKEMKIRLDKVINKNSTDYVAKVRQYQTLHEALPRMEWEALALEEANARGGKAGMAFAEQEAARLLKKGESALLAEQGKSSYIKIKQNAVQSHSAPVRSRPAPLVPAPDAALITKARESAKLAGTFLETPVQHFFDPTTGDLSYQVKSDKNRMQVLTPEQLADRILKEGNQLSNSSGDSMKTLKALEALEAVDAVARPQKIKPIVEVMPKNKPPAAVPRKLPVRIFR